MHLPRLPLEVFVRGTVADEPLAVRDGATREPRVLLCTDSAAQLGVRPGMRLGAAYALAGALCVLCRDEGRERDSLEGLAAWAGQFTSVLSLEPPQEILLEVGGSLRLLGGIEGLLRRVQQGIDELGYQVRLAFAPTPLAATWFARAGEYPGAMGKEALAAGIARLPLSCLHLTPEARSTLQGMGVRRVGDCLRLPRDGLARRLGPNLIRLLDQALGSVPDPRPNFQPPARFRSHLPLPGEVERSEGLLFAAHRQLTELAGFLQARGGGVQELTWTLHHRRCSPTEIRLGLAAPSRDPQHLHRLLHIRLERLQLSEPVQELTLWAEDILPLSARSEELFGQTEPEARDPAELLERLRARLGDEAVHGLCPVVDYRPERAWRCCVPGQVGDEVLPLGSASRPLWLLAEPIPLEVLGGQPILQGALALEADRERIESGWWDGADASRDYFVARNLQGERFWIFRELRGGRRWFVHGIFE